MMVAGGLSTLVDGAAIVAALEEELPAETPDRFNPIRVLESWVEEGRAPDHIPASAADPGTARVAEALLCPWPKAAVAGASDAAVAACDSGR